MVKKSSIFPQIWVPLMAEFTAQFFHTFWGVMATGPYVPPGNSSASVETGKCGNYLQDVMMPAIQAGLSVWMQIVVFWKISVAHFNPAISMGFLVSGHLKPIMFVPYVVMQCLGSVMAALIAKAILGADPAVISVPDDVSSVAVFFNEFMMTGILIFFAVAMVMDKSYDQATGPIAIGLTVFQGILSAQWVGVACISPSRAFGPTVVTGGASWNRHWLLWLSDLSGAAVASAFFMFMFAPKDLCWLLRLRKKVLQKPSNRSEGPQGVLIDENKKRDSGTNL